MLYKRVVAGRLGRRPWDSRKPHPADLSTLLIILSEMTERWLIAGLLGLLASGPISKIQNVLPHSF